MRQVPCLSTLAERCAVKSIQDTPYLEPFDGMLVDRYAFTELGRVLNRML